MRSALPLLSLVTLVLSSAACRFGEASFSSTMPGRSFDPAGTVFAYIDAHDDALVEDPNPRVAIAMTWIIFDPNGDLNDLEGSALEDYSHELKLRDAVALVFPEQALITAGAFFQHTSSGPPSADDTPGFEARLHLAPERLSGSTTYDGFVPFASNRIATVNVSSAGFLDAAPVVTGDLTVEFVRLETDPAEARTGVFTGTFRAPVVNERSAEQNLALLDIDDVLGLPLSAR